jgi:mannosyltransferase
MANLNRRQHGAELGPRAFVAAALVVLWAYGLRAYAVGVSPWRGDEGFAVTFVGQSLSKIIAAMATTEPNPPLYWLVLKGWMALAGRSELATRWPSVLAGVLTAALTYRLGRALLGPKAGLTAALLTACSPLLIWYAQDARVYSLVTMLVAAAAWQTWEAVRRQAWRYWLAAGGLWWLALFAHYFAVLPFAAVGLALLLAPETRRRWRAGLVLCLGVGLAQLPWALYVAPLMIGHSKNWIVPTNVAEALWKTLEAFGAGTTATGATPTVQWAGGALLACLCALGGWVIARRSLTALIWLAALGLGGPLFLGLISLIRPAFTEQYALPALPGILLIAAAALDADAAARARRIYRALAGAGLAGMALLALLPLTNIYFNPRYHGPMPVEAVPAAPMAQLGVPAAEAQLEKLRDSYQHIRFFIAPSPGYDPDGFAAQWFENCCEKLSDDVVAGLRVQTFDTPSGSLAARQPYLVDFADGITLSGYRLFNSEIAPGQAAHLTLFWTAREPPAQAYTVFIHVLAADGFDLLDADGPPVNNRRPTNGWQTAETIIDPHQIAIPADFSPGDYLLEIGLYVRATGVRLPVVAGSEQEANAVRLPVMLKVRLP